MEAYLIRMFVLCFIMEFLIGKGGPSYFTNHYQIPLPSGKALWEARSAWVWEKEYAARQGSSGGGMKLETVGDLALAHMERDGMGVSGSGESPGVAGYEVLDDWHAGVDGLGMLLAAVVADMV